VAAAAGEVRRSGGGSCVGESLARSLAHARTRPTRRDSISNWGNGRVGMVVRGGRGGGGFI
jgi:hypothetical protein